MSDRSPTYERFAYYDHRADIAGIRTDGSLDVVNEETGWGSIDHDADTDAVVGIEIREASRRLPADLLAAFPKFTACRRFPRSRLVSPTADIHETTSHLSWFNLLR
jgi:uncharacterized protein YuzE